MGVGLSYYAHGDLKKCTHGHLVSLARPSRGKRGSGEVHSSGKQAG